LLLLRHHHHYLLLLSHALLGLLLHWILVLQLIQNSCARHQQLLHLLPLPLLYLVPAVHLPQPRTARISKAGCCAAPSCCAAARLHQAMHHPAAAAAPALALAAAAAAYAHACGLAALYYHPPLLLLLLKVVVDQRSHLAQEMTRGCLAELLVLPP
jgi:hypothetical protein